MNKLIITLGFIAMVLLQLALPSKMIYDQHKAVQVGTPYKFKTQPIDPSDPFRGKYVFLNYEMDSFESQDDSWPRGSELYVYIAAGADGFAQATQISSTKLEIDQDFVLAEVEWGSGSEVFFSLPFNRFYMEEGKAYEAETAMSDIMDIGITIGGEGQTEPNTLCYALVYIYGETARLEDVFIDDVSIREVVLQNRAKEKAATQ